MNGFSGECCYGRIVSAIHTESAAELMELALKFLAGAVDVFRFGEEFHVFDERDICRLQYQFAGGVLFSVCEQQFVFIHLNFHGFSRVQDGNSAAAIIQQKLFEVIENALQHGHIDLFTVEICMLTVIFVVTGFQNDVHSVSERFQERQESIEQLFARNGGHQHGNACAGILVHIPFMAITPAWSHLKAVRRANCFCQQEISVAGNPHVIFQLFFSQVSEAAGAAGSSPITITGFEEIFEETHDHCSALV